ncbi:MAG: TlpA family protein disulfide reductase [Candidatus Bipolaricaulia bacterium]
MFKKVAIVVAIGLAGGLMALAGHSYITGHLLGEDRVLHEGAGTFWEADKAPKDSEARPRPGYPAPDFTLSTLEGKSVSLSDFEGKPVLLNFWATWCPPCRSEMPDLQDFYETYGDQVTLLGVNWAEKPDEVRTFLNRYGITYPNVLDRQGRAFVRYRLTGLPTTLFIDATGLVRGLWYGPLKTDQIADRFAEISTAFELKTDERASP